VEMLAFGESAEGERRDFGCDVLRPGGSDIVIPYGYKLFVSAGISLTASW
jgi:hypothetical protein